jgi:hypothetical protein
LFPADLSRKQLLLFYLPSGISGLFPLLQNNAHAEQGASWKAVPPSG